MLESGFMTYTFPKNICQAGKRFAQKMLLCAGDECILKINLCIEATISDRLAKGWLDDFTTKESASPMDFFYENSLFLLVIMMLMITMVMMMKAAILMQN